MTFCGAWTDCNRLGTGWRFGCSLKHCASWEFSLICLIRNVLKISYLLHVNRQSGYQQSCESMVTDPEGHPSQSHTPLPLVKQIFVVGVDCAGYLVQDLENEQWCRTSLGAGTFGSEVRLHIRSDYLRQLFFSKLQCLYFSEFVTNNDRLFSSTVHLMQVDT